MSGRAEAAKDVGACGEAGGLGGGGGWWGENDAAKVYAGRRGEGDGEAREGADLGDFVVGGVEGGGEDADEGLGGGGGGDGRRGGESEVGFEGGAGAVVGPGPHGCRGSRWGRHLGALLWLLWRCCLWTEVDAGQDSPTRWGGIAAGRFFSDCRLIFAPPSGTFEENTYLIAGYPFQGIQKETRAIRQMGES